MSTAEDVFGEMPQFRKNQGLAGQFAGIEAAGHAEQQGLLDKPGGGPRKQGGRIDFLVTQLGKHGAESGQLLVEQGAHRLDGDVGGTDPGPPGNEQGMRSESRNDFIHLRDNGRCIIGNNTVIHYLMAFSPQSSALSTQS